MSETGEKIFVFTPDAVPPLPIFCTIIPSGNCLKHTDTTNAIAQAVVSKGIVYASGNIGCDSNFKLVEGGVQAQTRAALRNLAIILQAAGSGLEHIVKANIYLANMPRDFQAMNEVYAEFLGLPTVPGTGTAVEKTGSDG
ncbi:YjgF-like protein [Pholiota conissans]|uniref:YjgF-like protein n=1 Tax=Pholiota conissans TaxID=109636 RepID=A0A9P5ZEA3_9AGAR|nr:YjgF-like protein [Pholiota conissans]